MGSRRKFPVTHNFLVSIFRSLTISHDWSAAFNLVTSMWWICQTDLWHWSTEATESPRFKRAGEEFYLNLWPQYIYKLKSFTLANTNLPLSKNNFTLILIAITFIPDPTTPVVRMNLYQRESRYNRIEPRFTSLPFFDTWRLPYRNWKRIQMLLHNTALWSTPTFSNASRTGIDSCSLSISREWGSAGKATCPILLPIVSPGWIRQSLKVPTKIGY